MILEGVFGIFVWELRTKEAELGGQLPGLGPVVQSMVSGIRIGVNY